MKTLKIKVYTNSSLKPQVIFENIKNVLNFKAQNGYWNHIFYLQVKRPPLHGYLEIDPPSLTSNTVTVFDQATINEGRLHYIQSISNQSSDSFIFDVTNGISSLNDLVFHFTILPKVWNWCILGLSDSLSSWASFGSLLPPSALIYENEILKSQ